ncbi:MAG: hypothetical protein P4M13_00925 [Alphaproteobacteria bacterium]|nr:hypothetical protein [Alphaproteobacteria bacterium]
METIGYFKQESQNAGEKITLLKFIQAGIALIGNKMANASRTLTRAVLTTVRQIGNNWCVCWDVTSTASRDVTEKLRIYEEQIPPIGLLRPLSQNLFHILEWFPALSV